MLQPPRFLDPVRLPSARVHIIISSLYMEEKEKEKEKEEEFQDASPKLDQPDIFFTEAQKRELAETQARGNALIQANKPESLRNVRSAYGSHLTLSSYKKRVKNPVARHLLAPLYYAFRKTKKNFARPKVQAPAAEVPEAPEAPATTHATEIAEAPAKQKMTEEEKAEAARNKKMWLDVVKTAIHLGKDFEIIQIIISSAIVVVEKTDRVKTSEAMNDLFFREFKHHAERNIELNGKSEDSKKLYHYIIQILITLKSVLLPYVGEMFQILVQKLEILNKEFVILFLKALESEVGDNYEKFEDLLQEFLTTDQHHLKLWVAGHAASLLTQFGTKHPELWQYGSYALFLKYPVRKIGEGLNKVRQSVVDTARHLFKRKGGTRKNKK